MSLPIGSSGDYQSWEDAERDCSGEEPETFRIQALEAAVKVARGEAVSFRDGILHPEIEYSWPLLAGLMYVAARNRGRLRLIDFGGGPAVTYLQNRRFLRHLSDIDWRIVERADYCAFCRQNLRLFGVSYHESLAQALSTGPSPDAIVLSGVLNMLPEPYQLLRDITRAGIPHILIDRLSMNLEGRDRLAVYRVDPAHHPNMSFPNWWFDEAKLVASLKAEYDLVERFEAFHNPAPWPSERLGFIFSRRASSS